MTGALSANQNAGLRHKINSANHGAVECVFVATVHAKSPVLTFSTNILTIVASINELDVSHSVVRRCQISDFITVMVYPAYGRRIQVNCHTLVVLLTYMFALVHCANITGGKCSLGCDINELVTPCIWKSIICACSNSYFWNRALHLVIATIWLLP